MADDYTPVLPPGSGPVTPSKPQQPSDDFTPVLGAEGKPAGDRKILENTPGGDDLLPGMAKNTATGAIKGVGMALGQVGDLEDLFALGLGAGQSLFNGKTTSENFAELQSRMKGIRDYGRKVGQPDFSAPKSSDVTGPIFAKTGEYVPETEAGRLGQAGTAGAVSMVAGPGSKVRNALVGAVVGAGSEEASRLAGPGAGLAVGLAMPSLFHRIGNLYGNTFGPQRDASHRRGAGERLLKVTDNPAEAVMAQRDPNAPHQTLADVTGDRKQAIAEATAEKLDPDFRARVDRRRMNQREGHADQISGLADPSADPRAVSRMVEQHLDDMGAARDTMVRGMQRDAQHALENAPQGGALEEISQRIQQGAYDAGRRMRAGLDRLARTIDPEGRMGVRPMQARAYAEELLPRMHEQVKPSAANPYIEKAATLPDVVPFQQLWNLDIELSSAISQAARADDQLGLGQLRGLKGAVKQSIAKAVDNQAAWEHAEVQAGRMRPEETLVSKLRQWRDDWYARQNAGARTSDNAVQPPAFVPSVRPGASPAGGGSSGGAGGARGVSGPAALEPVDPATAVSHATFNREYGTYKDVHRSGPVGKGTERAAFGDQFKDPLGGLNAFQAGDRGAENVRAWLRANPDGLPEIQRLAAQRLRQTLGDSTTLEPGQLDAWKRRYGPALRAIDEVAPGFSSSFDRAATLQAAGAEGATRATAAGRADTRGPLARLMGLEHAEDVVASIGRMMTAQDGARQIGRLMDIAQGRGQVDNVRGAARDWILNRLVTGAKTSELDPALSPFKLEAFIRNNPDTMRRLFGPNGAEVLDRIAEQTARFQRTQGMKQAAVGSDTAQYLLPAYTKLQKPPGHGVESSVDAFALFEGLGGNPVRAAQILGGRMVLTKLRTMVERWRQRGLQKEMDLFHEALLDPKVGQDLLRETLQTDRGKKISALEALMRARVAAQGTIEGQEQRRRGHARGGTASDDAAKHAARMVAMVSIIRRQHGERTKPLLKLPDNTIADALAAARQVAG